MNYRILVPYWGNDPRYIHLLGEWIEAYRRSRCSAPFTIITDQWTNKFGPYDWYMVHTDRHDPRYIFDHKGDIVAGAVKRILDPVLVLDTDAFLVADPEPLLWPFHDKEFAMPLDEGALHRCLRNRNGLPTPIKKRCAGVLWFGNGGNRRSLLAGDYYGNFNVLLRGGYLEERRLYEQHAWTMVAYYNAAPFLPRELNWLANNTGVGANPNAVIHHLIGQKKFRDCAFSPNEIKARHV